MSEVHSSGIGKRIFPFGNSAHAREKRRRMIANIGPLSSWLMILPAADIGRTRATVLVVQRHLSETSDLTKPGKETDRRLSFRGPNDICRMADQREEPPLWEAVWFCFEATTEAKAVASFLFQRWFVLDASGGAEEHGCGLPQLMTANEAAARRPPPPSRH